MEHNLYFEISVIIAIGTAIAIIMRLLRQPLIIGHILTGLLVGPTVFNLVRSGEVLTGFSDIGIALLLFLVGLGLNPKIIKEVGRVALFTGVGQVVLTTVLGFTIVSGITDLDSRSSLYAGIALSFSSTIIILKLLNDKRQQTRLHGKIITGFLLVQDLIATFALLFVSANASGGLNSNDLVELILKSVIVVSLLYIISTGLLPKLTKTISGSQELLFLFSITWGLGIGAVFKQIGFSLEVGALAAGVAMAGLPYAQEAASRLKPLRDFFIVLFFVSLGSQLDLRNIISVLPTALILSIFVLIGKPLTVLPIMGMLGYTKKTSFKTSIAIAQISEFSLVLLLLANKSGQFPNEALSLITVVGLITIAVSSYLVMYDEKMFVLFERYLSLFERKKTKSERQKPIHHDLVLFGYKKGGSEFIKVFQKLKKRFIVIDYDPEVIDVLEKVNIPYLYGDMTDPELLEEAGLEHTKLIVSAVTDHETNKFLLQTIATINTSCVIICHADSVNEASELYDLGASYVMLPHYIGSEKIGAFIGKNGLSKSEFKKFRNQHLSFLQSKFEDDASPTT